MLRLMERCDNVPVMLFGTPQEWEAWLDAHDTQPEGLWLKIAKKGADTPTVSYAEALDGALCYGWIDGQKRGYDEQFFLQKFTPRRPGSVWSKINTEKTTALIAAGRMKDAGLREIEAAKRDGRWDAAYHPQSTQTVPPDFQAALDDHPQARAFFETLNKANRYGMCYRVHNAKRPETRAARIAQFIAMLEAGEQLHP